jgi:hypothetical protein
MASKIIVQMVHEHQCIATNVSAAGTTETLMGEATRLFRLHGRNVTLLVDGQRMKPGVPLSKSALVCSAQHMRMKNVTVKSDYPVVNADW